MLGGVNQQVVSLRALFEIVSGHQRPWKVTFVSVQGSVKVMLGEDRWPAGRQMEESAAVLIPSEVNVTEGSFGCKLACSDCVSQRHGGWQQDGGKDSADRAHDSLNHVDDPTPVAVAQSISWLSYCTLPQISAQMVTVKSLGYCPAAIPIDPHEPRCRRNGMQTCRYIQRM
jgi:hypothetical protein